MGEIVSGQIVAKNYESANSFKNKVEEKFYNYIPFKMQLVDLNGLFHKCVLHREMNGVVKLNNGYITIARSSYDAQGLSDSGKNIIAFNDYCKENGVVFLYAQTAFKISKFDSQLPVGVTDVTNQAIDEMIEILKKADVHVLDLRECMYDDGINQYDLYYRTDHHWTNEGAFYGYTKIAPLVANLTGTFLDTDLLDFENYNVETYKKWHLGSRGQRTGLIFASPDDYNLISPKFKTRIFDSSDNSIQDLKEALVKKTVFENRNAASRYTYDQAYTNRNVNNLTSLDAKTDLNVLLLSDSFQQGIKQFMLLTYKDFNIDSYWNLSPELIAKYNPDVIIMLPFSGNITGQINFINSDE
ncbi:MAG: DHHW family protein [Treponema sp.]